MATGSCWRHSKSRGKWSTPWLRVSHTHLGIPTGFSVDAQTPYAAVSDLRAIDRSHLAPWQKKKTLGIFVLPRLDFLLWGARVFKGSLTAVDLNIRKYVKSWHNPLQRASSKRVYMLRNWAQDRLPPSCEDIASGSLDERMRGRGEASLRSSTRNAALRQSREISALAVGRGHRRRWRWNVDVGMSAQGGNDKDSAWCARSGSESVTTQL